MKVIRHPESVQALPEGDIRQRISAELDSLLEEFPEAYDPAVHGWFVVLENPEDLTLPVWPGCPFTCDTLIREQRYEWLVRNSDHYQWITMLGDNEALMIFLPCGLLHDQPALTASLASHATSVAYGLPGHG